jgi:hypothetical protein
VSCEQAPTSEPAGLPLLAPAPTQRLLPTLDRSSGETNPAADAHHSHQRSLPLTPTAVGSHQMFRYIVAASQI